MSRVSYFQRFSQRENHATNNTLLILRYLYQSSPFKMERTISSLIDENCTIGLSFSQQVKGTSSIPDALISQNALRIFIETKRGDELDTEQIRRHLESIVANGAEHQTDILLGITKEPIPIAEALTLKKDAKKRRVLFAAVTFSQILDALMAECEDYESDLMAMIEDFDQYLAEEGLLAERNQWLPIFPCGTSYAENVQFDLYYEPPSRPCKRNYRFIGIYALKAVSRVGVVEAIVVASYVNGNFSLELEAGNLTDSHRKRIKKVTETTEYYNLAIGSTRFYLVDSFAETNLRKTTSGGIRGMRYLDLATIIPDYDTRKAYSSAELANRNYS